MCLHLSALGCGTVAPIPDTPNLEELQTRYDHPTAVLHAGTAQDALDEVPQLLDLAGGLRATPYAIEGVNRADDLAVDRAAQGIRVQGTVNATLECPGASGSRDGGANGSLLLTIGVAETKVLRGIHGVAQHCVLRSERLQVPLRVEIDGGVDFDLGRDLALGTHWTGRLLVVVLGSITIEGVPFRNVSGRITDALFEHLLELEDGTTVVLQVTEEGPAIRDSERIWSCSSGQPCNFH